MDRRERHHFNSLMDEIHQTVYLLYYSVNLDAKNTLLRRLEEQLSQLSQFFYRTLHECEMGYAVTMPVQDELKMFSISELSNYDGTNGNPAYVAVNGTVYDVTNNPAWAAATHFGLKAGTDVTEAFASCHANKDLLSELSVVGRLQDE